MPPAVATAPERGRRRWWSYLVWAFGSLAFLAFALLAAAWFYWVSLIRTYTSEKAETLPKVESVDTRFAELKERWDAYTRRFIHRREPIPAYELTAEDLNLVVNHAPALRNQAFIELRPPHLRVQFSVPLDRTGNSQLQGRFLNGVAQFKPEYSGHQLNLHLVSLEANRKPIPGWALRRLQRTNWGEALSRRPEFDLALRALERIDVEADRIVLHPAADAR